MRTLATPAPATVRSVVSPLLPVLLALALAALALSIVFARLFPSRTGHIGAAITFADITAESGLRFVHQPAAGTPPTSLGGGVAVFDYDRDGAPDLFLVNGAPWPWEESLGKHSAPSHALLRNDGRGRFTDVTASAGLNVTFQGMAAVTGDYDGDGREDLFVTAVGPNRLFRNLGDGRFEDVTEFAGVAGDDNSWSTGAAWHDCDHDGHLDLIVLHYARWPREVGLQQAFAVARLGRSYGAPAGFTGAFPTVYRNTGDGRFAAVPNAAGLRDIDPETGRPVPHPLAIGPLDANDDGRIDFLITYLSARPALFLARPDGTFARTSLAPDRRQEGATALLAVSPRSARERTAPDPRGALLVELAGTDVPGALAPKLGVAAADFDLDGRFEIFSGEARIEASIGQLEPGSPLARSLALRRTVHASNPHPVSSPLVARGVATGDFDADGDLDVVVAQYGGSARLWRNDQPHSPPWLRIQLAARSGSARTDGAQVEVHTPRGVWRQTYARPLGFLAQSQDGFTFGLGEDARVRKLVIRWPSGQVQELPAPALNRTHVITEP